MNRVKELVRSLAPKGVPRCALRDVASFKRGQSLTRAASTPGEIPVLAGGRTPAYFHGAANRSGESIVVAGSGAYAGFVSFWSAPVFVSDAFTVEPDLEILRPKYVYYCLAARQSEIHALKAGAGVPHVHGKDLAPLAIFVPPLQVQDVIIDILDDFAELEAELEAELKARRAQLEFYKRRLLERIRAEASEVPIGQVADLNWGDTNTTKSSYVAEGFVAYSAAGPDGFLNHYEYERPGVVLSAIGALAGKTWRAQGKWSCIKNTIRFFPQDDNEVTTDYLYWITSTPGFWPRRGSAQPFIAKTDADKLMIPLPGIETQRKVTETLDMFDALVNGLNIGLPAELAARRKQYEYYRDELLTFQEAPA